MAELADAQDSGSCVRKDVRVQVPPRPPQGSYQTPDRSLPNRFVTEKVFFPCVDESGSGVPTETIGRLRIRSRSLPRGYAYLSVPDDSFQDGWFYSGDLAAQRVDGSVSLHGRSNEVINFNGVKINPEYLDGMLLSVPGVHDLAVFSVEGEVGEINAVVGIVVGDDFDLPTLQAEFSKFAQGLSIAGIFRVTEIPRSPMGKPLRKALAEQYRSAE